MESTEISHIFFAPAHAQPPLNNIHQQSGIFISLAEPSLINYPYLKPSRFTLSTV